MRYFLAALAGASTAASGFLLYERFTMKGLYQQAYDIASKAEGR